MSKSGGTRTHRKAARLALAVVACVIGSEMMRGQSADTEVGEVAAFGGGTFGIGTHPAVGGSTGLAFSRYSIALIETAFSPLGANSSRPAPAGGPIDTSRLYDFNLAMHIRVPVRDRWAPYAILGGGLLWNTLDQRVTGPLGAPAVRHLDYFDFAFHTGAGLRYYVSDKWGVRPEFKVIVSKQTYTRLSVGIFYVLPESWP
jgi:hypothetical protein